MGEESEVGEECGRCERERRIESMKHLCVGEVGFAEGFLLLWRGRDVSVVWVWVWGGLAPVRRGGPPVS